MDVRGQMRRAAEIFGGQEAVIQGQRRLTFREAWSRGLRAANLLLDMGLRPGDRLGVLDGNTIEAVDVLLGAAAANIVRVPLYARNSRLSHEYMLQHTDCKALIVAESYVGEIEGLDLPWLKSRLVYGSEWDSLLEGYPDKDPSPDIRPTDEYIIRHTGGTSGKPKGVAYSHWKWLAAGRDWFYPWPGVQVGDACLHVAPLAHGSGYLFVPVWLGGGKNVLLERFEPLETLTTLEEEQISYAFMVPTILSELVREPTASTRSYPSLKVLNVAAAPIAESTARRALDTFGRVLYQTYGQTEALPATSLAPDDWLLEIDGSTPIRSAGRPLPFAEIEIRDLESLEPVAAGAAGEIAIRTDAQMTGYWSDVDVASERVADGWILTGDIGRFDDNGFLYILDRKDDMIISGGLNIWPAELENVLLEHPAVREAAVFAIPNDKWGESPAAVCSISPGEVVTESTLIQLCAIQLGSHKKPAFVRLTDAPLPKSPVGKIQRKVLASEFWESRDRRVSGS